MPKVPKLLHDEQDVVQIADHMIILFKKEATRVRPTRVVSRPATGQLPGGEIVPPSPEKISLLTPEKRGSPSETETVLKKRTDPKFATRPEDEFDNIIITDLPQREWSIDVEEGATGKLSITNDGGLVAAFEIRVTGIDSHFCGQ